MGRGERVPVEELGGRRFAPGTVYYSREQRGFLRAGEEEAGPISLRETWDRVRWRTDRSGVARFIDETGRFVGVNVFQQGAGTNFGRTGPRVVDERVSSIRPGAEPGPDAQFVERLVVTLPNGRVRVIEISHGIGNEYDPSRQRAQWTRKIREALGIDPDEDVSSLDMQGRVVSREVILRRTETLIP